MRIRSRTDTACSPIVNRGCVSPTIHEIVSSSRIRIPIARPSPMVRARSRCSAGSRCTSTEMNTTLSMPRTISMTVRVSRAIQASGFVIQSMAASVAVRRRSALPARRADRHYHHGRHARPASCPSSTSSPPVVAAGRPRATRSRPRTSGSPSSAPSPARLPSFFVWTLGCQMNKSDSEEMAGRLLAAGCPEAPSMEAADLVVINTCAIREAAEAKVIGRQGHLGRLKAANPGLRVVMTGCSVRESNRAGLARRYPAVDLFLRPDEEPELVDRLGLASAQAPVGAFATTAATTLVKGAPVSDATHLVRARADADRRRRGQPRHPRSAPGCRSSTAATRPAPTASSRSAGARSAAARSTRSWTRRAPWPPRATARSRSSARTSTATATTCRPSRGSPTSTRSGPWGGARTARRGRTWRS